MRQRASQRTISFVQRAISFRAIMASDRQTLLTCDRVCRKRDDSLLLIPGFVSCSRIILMIFFLALRISKRQAHNYCKKEFFSLDTSLFAESKSDFNLYNYNRELRFSSAFLFPEMKDNYSRSLL